MTTTTHIDPMAMTRQQIVELLGFDVFESARRSEMLATMMPDWEEEDREKSIRRYARFLMLALEYRGEPIAPTRGIDMIWHIHMMSPVAYSRCCDRLFGQILDHDGGFGQTDDEMAELGAVFEVTSQRWQAFYGDSYAESSESTKCWHDCQGRCWHECKSK